MVDGRQFDARLHCYNGKKYSRWSPGVDTSLPCVDTSCWHLVTGLHVSTPQNHVSTHHAVVGHWPPCVDTAKSRVDTCRCISQILPSVFMCRHLKPMCHTCSAFFKSCFLFSCVDSLNSDIVFYTFLSQFSSDNLSSSRIIQLRLIRLENTSSRHVDLKNIFNYFEMKSINFWLLVEFFNQLHFFHWSKFSLKSSRELLKLEISSLQLIFYVCLNIFNLFTWSLSTWFLRGIFHQYSFFHSFKIST